MKRRSNRFSRKDKARPLWDAAVVLLGDGTVLVECGPMRMFVEASKDGVPQPNECRQAGGQAVGFLEEVASERARIAAPAISLAEPTTGTVAYTMWQAAALVGDPDLTPMAAVAGAIADATADFLEERGMTRVVVNNGGDLAVRLKGGERLSVGIRPDVQEQRVTHRVFLSAPMGIRGVATSGLGGRSFTRGIASAVTVFGSSAAIADAAATAVANATHIPDPAVTRRKADSIYPDTDLKGVEVTVSVGALTKSQIATALRQGRSRGEELVGRGLITGACVFVKGRMAATERLSTLLEPLRQ